GGLASFPDGDHLTHLLLRQRCELADRLLLVHSAHDVVAVEHGARLVPGDAHRHALRHPGPRHQVPHATPAQVLNQPSLKTTPDLVLPRIRRMGLRSPRSPTRGRLASTITRK